MENRYGPLLIDNGDEIATVGSAFNLDRDAFVRALQTANPIFAQKAVHGHFWLPKYDHVSALRLTIIRHPVARTISNFLHFRRMPPSPLKPPFPLRDDVYSGRITLDEFARRHEMRHFYSETMFGGVDMQRFDFIGRFEALQSEVEELGRLLNIPTPLPHVNAAGRDEPELSLSADLLAKDIAFYDKWAGSGAARP